MLLPADPRVIFQTDASPVRILCTPARNLILSENLNLVSVAVALIGALLGIVVQITTLAKRNRLRSRLRASLELRRELVDQEGPAYVSLRAKLDRVAEHCARELALAESMWLRRASSTTFNRLELVASLAAILVAAGFVGGVALMARDVPVTPALITIATVIATVVTVVIMFERGLSRDIESVSEAMRRISSRQTSEAQPDLHLRGRWLRASAGVYEPVLLRHPESAIRHTRIGMLTFAIPAMTASALWWALNESGTSPAVSIPATVAYAAFDFWISRFATVTSRPKQLREWVSLLPRVMIFFITATVIVEPVILGLFAYQIEEHLAASGTHDGLLARMGALSAIASEDHFV